MASLFLYKLKLDLKKIKLRQNKKLFKTNPVQQD